MTSNCYSNDESSNDVAITCVLIVGIFFTMVAMGIDLDIDGLRDAARRPKASLLGLFCQSFINPLLFMLIVTVFDLSKEQSVAAVLIGSSPGGLGSNFYTWLCGGNIALSIFMTTCSTVSKKRIIE